MKKKVALTDLNDHGNDPEWNVGVAKFSQTYAKYSFEKNECDDENEPISSNQEKTDEIKDIWY